jgi:hypothetical protein
MEDQKQSVLLIGGFNCHIEEQGLNSYDAFHTFFSLSEEKYDLEIYTYATTRNLNSVYDNIKHKLETTHYDVILAHSTGCCLLTKYLSESVNSLSSKKIVMMMPFICKTWNLTMLSYIPGIQNISIPKCIIIPNHQLFDAGNICNDSINLVKCKQIYQAVAEDFMLEENVLVSTLNNNTNITIIYAEKENVSPIPDRILQQFENIIYIKNGLHMDFMNALTSSKFFSILSNILRKQLKET